jgi:hypothetical protein
LRKEKPIDEGGKQVRGIREGRGVLVLITSNDLSGARRVMR